MTRARLPDRRPSVTMELVHDCRPYSVTIGFDLWTGKIGEVFTHGAKIGSAMDGILDDACIALSLLLQHGVDPQHSLPAWVGSVMARHRLPVIGALTDLRAEGEAQP